MKTIIEKAYALNKGDKFLFCGVPYTISDYRHLTNYVYITFEYGRELILLPQDSLELIIEEDIFDCECAWVEIDKIKIKSFCKDRFVGHVE